MINDKTVAKLVSNSVVATLLLPGVKNLYIVAFAEVCPVVASNIN